MIYNQPLSTRFGDELINNLNSGKWNKLEIAVAWVRSSGIAHLNKSISAFLSNKCSITIIIGIDLNNTSLEGLLSLLALKKYGEMKVFVYHNESGGIFHPKMYLFTNKIEARLIIGSNNLTQSGLYQNTEMGISVDLPIGSPIILSAKTVLASWADIGTGIVKELNNEFLDELVGEGYVQSEKTIKKNAEQKEHKTKLFGSIPISTPAFPKMGNIKGKDEEKTDHQPNALGKVLLMRIRKAQAQTRPTQTQVPIELARSEFFEGIDSVTSSHDGEKHKISAAHANGKINTMKLEIPEMRDFNDPVIRFSRDVEAINYEVYDRESARGSDIMRSLIEGKGTKPPKTTLTKPGSPETSTWWRFI